MTSLLVLCCLFLPVLSLEKRSPLDLGSLGTRDRWTPKSDKKSYNSYSDQNKNHSFEVFKGNPTEYTIGGVLSGAPGVEFYFTQVLSDVEHQMLSRRVSLNKATQIMDTNPIKTAITVCSELIQKKVYAIIVSKPSKGDLSPASVSYTAGFYHIPVIGISSRDSAFSDKNIHVSFMRTVPPYSHQANVWVEMLKQFKYRQLVFIHSSDTDGRALLGRFQTETQDLDETDDQEVKVEKVEEFEPGKSSYYDTLLKIKECQARVYFLYASTSDAEQLFRDASRLNMTGSGNVWIVTEQALLAPNVPSGTLGLELVAAANEEGHIKDSLSILAMALNELNEKENVTEAPSNCNTSGAVWDTGKQLFEYIRKQTLADGTTGRVAFDEMGDRIYAEYQVVNVQKISRGNPAQKVVVGNYKYSNSVEKMKLSLDEDKIIWPGGMTQKPTGLMIPTHLKVLTILDKPFVYSRPLLEPGDTCDVANGEILCPHYDTELTVEVNQRSNQKSCCSGYCIDLLRLLGDHCNFTYSLHLSFNEYGSLERNNKTGKQDWNGLIGQLVQEYADLIVAPLTINPERAQVMEFSKPFKYQGITILQKRQPRASQLVSFLQPFKSTLWVLVLVSVHVVALCLYLLDRFSPFGRFETRDSSRPADHVQKEESLNFTSAIWFAWGVLLNSGIGEGTPRSFSARVLGMVWAGFAMIIVASYTANLAAFLVLDKPQTSLTGINDPRLRNPMENFTYATVKASAVDMYFRRQVELSNMYRTMEGKHYRNPEEAIEAVKSGVLKAFIWDSSRLEFEAARDCDLITAGDLFGRSGYGVGLQKGSPWADKITLAILDFHESGKMEDLDNKWILLNKEVKCDSKDDNSPATLGLSNMRGVFILVGVGIVGGVGLIILEIIFKKHKRRTNKSNSVAKTAVRKWRGNVEKRRTIRESRESNKKILKSNGSTMIQMRSSGSGAQLIRTPDSSVTLSVGSLPQRPMHPSEAASGLGGHSGGSWRSPMSEHEQLPPPPVYREAIQLSKEDLRSPIASEVICKTSREAEVEVEVANIADEDVPPPVPPHRTPVPERPKSAMDQTEIPNHQRYYDEVELKRRGSRERLLDQCSHTQHMYANKLHRSVGSGLEDHKNHVKSPSSSDSSRKRKVLIIQNHGVSGNNSDVIVKPITPSRMKQQQQQSSRGQDRRNHSPVWGSNSRPMDHHDMLSSPEYPSTSSDLRMIPQPPPPPKAYYRHHHGHNPRHTHHSRTIAAPLSHHPNAVRRNTRSTHYITDDSDV